ncbi:hypothetical protein GCM10020258_31420 [Sphingomonas yabuuchiae]
MTANRDFLAPYDQGALDFDRAMKDARQLTGDNPGQQLRLTDVGALAKRWRDEVARPNIALMAVPATQAEARVSAAKGLGKALMDRLRAQTGAVIATENRLLAERQASQEAAFVMISRAIFGGMLISLLLAVAILILLVRQIARPVNAVTDGLTALASGNMAVTSIDADADRRDEVGQLAAALGNLRGRLLAADEAKNAQARLIVDSVGAALSKLAEGDLLSRLDSDLDGPFAAIKRDFNRAADALQAAMAQVSASTGASSTAPRTSGRPRTTCRNGPSSRRPAWKKPPPRWPRSRPPYARRPSRQGWLARWSARPRTRSSIPAGSWRMRWRR